MLVFLSEKWSQVVLVDSSKCCSTVTTRYLLDLFFKIEVSEAESLIDVGRAYPQCKRETSQNMSEEPRCQQEPTMEGTGSLLSKTCVCQIQKE